MAVSAAHLALASRDVVLFFAWRLAGVEQLSESFPSCQIVPFLVLWVESKLLLEIFLSALIAFSKLPFFQHPIWDEAKRRPRDRTAVSLWIPASLATDFAPPFRAF